MNGSNGIQPTVELATTNGTYPYFVGNGYGSNNGFFGGEGLWAIVLLALLFGNGGWGGFGGMGNGMYEFPWLMSGQQGINSNTNNGFDTLHLSNQLEGNRDAINNLSTQLCSGIASINGNMSNGFYNSEISANNRQMANMQQNYADQIATLQAFNNLGSRFDTCCCENRLGIANLNSTILAENCADRAALNEGVRDIITNATSNTQAVLDKLCQLELDNKNSKINDLEREILMKDLKASQVEQTATLRLGQEAEVDALYNRLSNCPVGTVPVYGKQPIFTCNNGCGCGNNGFYGTI